MAAMPVYCRPTGGDPVMVEMPPDATVADLAEAVGAVLGRVPRLRFQGRDLPPGAALADEGICAEAVVEEGLPGAHWHPDHCVGATFGCNPSVATLDGSQRSVVVCSAPVTAPGQMPSSPPGFLFSVDRSTSARSLRVGFALTADPSAGVLGDRLRDLCMELHALGAGAYVRVACALDDQGRQCILVHHWEAGGGDTAAPTAAFKAALSERDVQYDGAVPAWGWVCAAPSCPVAVTLRWQSPDPFPADIPAPRWPTAQEITLRLGLQEIEQQLDELRSLALQWTPAIPQGPPPQARELLRQRRRCALM
eukprot:TRINITY_DN12482_c0_g1_i3.p2 TRINITY_DN12482_c0_g1~~TRINITY_DN12482_c0_g1_i3.p2  ORF type:complete len:332 (+),score=66.39 TRINITY_DN12482_c0_g1_i3:75-998(+)